MALAPRLMKTPGVAPKQDYGVNRPIKFEARIGVQAPPAVLWDLLSDPARWPSWCPIYPQAAGEIRIGARLSLTVDLPGKAPRQAAPTILDWVPQEQILWSDRVWRGWAKPMRFIEIDQLDANACIVANGEVYRGTFAELYAEANRKALKRGFAVFNEALKAEAESLFKAGVGGAK
jgi:hypothetical protein